MELTDEAMVWAEDVLGDRSAAGDKSIPNAAAVVRAALELRRLGGILASEPSVNEGSVWWTRADANRRYLEEMRSPDINTAEACIWKVVLLACSEVEEAIAGGNLRPIEPAELESFKVKS